MTAFLAAIDEAVGMVAEAAAASFFFLRRCRQGW